MGVSTSDAEISYKQTAIPCAKPVGNCKTCRINTRYAYCTVEETMNNCGLLKVYGILAAVLIPMCAFVGIAALVVEKVDSIAWNSILGVIYM